MKLDNLDYITVFPEMAASNPDIPSVGRVTGIVDYLVAETDDLDPYNHGGIISTVEPALVVVEAKRSAIVTEKSSTSQFIAQLLCIQRQEFQSRYCHFLLNTDGASGRAGSPVGLLTNGEVWRIFFLQPYTESAINANELLWAEGGELFISRKIITTMDEDKRQLLGI
jgi:hypothetical protein